jgi:N-acetylglutamate synthase-like GNAT family acetyltransferase
MARIRRVTLEDVNAIAPLLREAYRGEAERDGDPVVLDRVASPDVVRDQILQEETYVLEEEGRIVATGVLQPLAYLRRVATLPSEQRKGYACQLVEFLMARAEKEGYSHIGLDTDAVVPGVEEWYWRYGFEITADTIYLPANFRTRYMEKALGRGAP